MPAASASMSSQSQPEPTLQFFLYIQSAASFVTPAVTAQSSPAVRVITKHAKKMQQLVVNS